MGFLEQLLDVEFGLPARFIIAFVIVLLLIALTAWIIRRLAVGRAGMGGVRAHQQRLAVIDAAHVDAKRRLILVRRDNIEHLILIGGPSDIVVESGIGQRMEKQATEPARPALRNGESARHAPPARAPEPPRYPEPPRQVRATPRPPAATGAPPPRAEPTMRPASVESATPRPEPRVAMPPVRPAAQPQTSPRPSAPSYGERAQGDPQLEQMAQRLEAALKRPIGSGPPVPPRPDAAPPQRPQEPPRPQPRTAPEVDLAAATATELEPGEVDERNGQAGRHRRAPEVDLYDDETPNRER